MHPNGTHSQNRGFWSKMAAFGLNSDLRNSAIFGQNPRDFFPRKIIILSPIISNFQPLTLNSGFSSSMGRFCSRICKRTFSKSSKHFPTQRQDLRSTQQVPAPDGAFMVPAAKVFENKLIFLFSQSWHFLKRGNYSILPIVPVFIRDFLGGNKINLTSKKKLFWIFSLFFSHYVRPPQW